MVIGIRVTAENIQTRKVKHCNSSYFTMVAKDDTGKNVTVPRLILSNLEEVRRFCDAMRRIKSKKEHKELEQQFDYTTAEALKTIENLNIKIHL